MSEKPRDNLEERENLSETQAEKLLPTPEQAEPLRKGEKDPAEMLEAARTEVEETARSETQHNPLGELEESEKTAKPPKPQYVSPELKQATLNKELGAIRRSLSMPGRTFSKVIHQPVVRAVSEPAAKTISRPSGLFGGGLVAFLGTSGYLYLAKQQGMSYNYFIFLGLLAGGFLVGLVLELFIHLATTHRRDAKG